MINTEWSEGLRGPLDTGQKDLEWLWTEKPKHPADNTWRHVKDGYYIGKKSNEFDRYIMMMPAEGELLAKYSSQAKIGIVEIGRKYGGSTLIIASHSSVPVTSIDWNPLEVEKIQQILKENTRVTLLKGDSRKVKIDSEFDVLFVDGMHKSSFIKADLNNHWPNLTIGGYALFHDMLFYDYTGKKYGISSVNDAVKELIPVYGEIVEQVGTLAVVRKVCELEDES